VKRILVLFPKEWDRLEFARPEYASRYEFVYAVVNMGAASSDDLHRRFHAFRRKLFRESDFAAGL
jgi:hypothetical protein